MSRICYYTPSNTTRWPSVWVKAPPGIIHRCYKNTTSSATTTTTTTMNVNFGLRVAKRVLQDAVKEKNTLCSPIAMVAALNVVAAGATGKMRVQLLSALECGGAEEVNSSAAKIAEVLQGSEDEDALDVSFANALWVDRRYALKPRFRDVLRDVHKTLVRDNADFQTQADRVVNEANIWAEEKTKGFIKQILSSDCITHDTMMIIANALYFKGVWENTFKPENTKEEDFHLHNGDKVRVPFIRHYDKRFEYGELKECKCKVLRMPYRKGEALKAGGKPRAFSMYIFLPDEKDGLSDLMEDIVMDANLFNERIHLVPKKIDRVDIPKFSFEYDLSITKPMKQLGLTLPFCRDCPELSEIVKSPYDNDWPYLSDVFQKCRIELDEQGTKAAAITHAHMRSMGAAMRPRPPPLYFVADHPFMFMIREDFSGAILFVGTMLNPLLK